ncbi:MAG: hypothetical protein RLZZ241_639 [Bacteroidota bacterium]|jgi:hypothetical protein
MSKRALKTYLEGLSREDLSEQVLDLYDRFKDVKVFYDFVFNPKEDQLLNQAKERIAKEYTARGRKRPKARRSVAHKILSHFKVLGVHPQGIAEVMVYNLELALRYEQQYNCNPAFYKSIYKSFLDLKDFVQYERLFADFENRIHAIHAALMDSNGPFTEELELD